jgi:hypothetical protein
MVVMLCIAIYTEEGLMLKADDVIILLDGVPLDRVKTVHISTTSEVPCLVATVHRVWNGNKYASLSEGPLPPCYVKRWHDNTLELASIPVRNCDAVPPETAQNPEC